VLPKKHSLASLQLQAEGGSIRDATKLQHVEHRLVNIYQCLWGLRKHLRFYPQRQNTG